MTSIRKIKYILYCGRSPIHGPKIILSRDFSRESRFFLLNWISHNVTYVATWTRFHSETVLVISRKSAKNSFRIHLSMLIHKNTEWVLKICLECKNHMLNPMNGQKKNHELTYVKYIICTSLTEKARFNSQVLENKY